MMRALVGRGWLILSRYWDNADFMCTVRVLFAQHSDKVVPVHGRQNISKTYYHLFDFSGVNFLHDRVFLLGGSLVRDQNESSDNSDTGH